MTTQSHRKRSTLSSTVVVALWCAVAASAVAQVSAFGRYEGFSAADWDGWNRRSEYVPMRDGIELAVDTYLPTRAGVPPTDPVPVVLHYTRYSRAFELDDGSSWGIVEEEEILQELLAHGYAVAVADARGTGASFGVHDGPFAMDESRDAYDLVEWLADQPWCDGEVGMSGRSYPGMTQYLAAAQRPPHLEAIFAEMAGPSVYDFVYTGGTYKKDFVTQWGKLTKKLDLGKIAPSAPVDADADGSERDAAVREHRGNLWAKKIAKKAKHRDSTWDRKGVFWSWEIASSIYSVEDIAASGVAIYHLVGWYDLYTNQQPMLYAALEGAPQKMMIGPWIHGGGFGDEVHRAEVIRFFDYWLKGIDNGVMDEDPVHYYVMEGDRTVPEVPGAHVSDDEVAAADGRSWRSTARWPPRGTDELTLYLGDGPSGTVVSVNDGLLGPALPTDTGRDEYEVDYSSTVGSFSRWMDGYGGQREDGTSFFDERTSEDEKALTWTTEALDEPLTLLGYPVLHLWVSSTHDDGDFFAYLEEVDEAGRSHYVTEGALRASHRAVADAPWPTFGLPYHPSVRDQVEPLPDGGAEPVELVIELLGTATVVDAGHRLRLTVAGADAENHALYPDKKGHDAPTVTVYRTVDMPSRLELTVE